MMDLPCRFGSVWFAANRLPNSKGTPAVRRIKTYSAQTGYVHQYYFDGSRYTQASKEYRFWARTNAGEYKAVFVRVPEALVLQWGKAHGRELVETEQYGIAKMLLFQHFDEAASGGDLGWSERCADRAGSGPNFRRSSI